MTLLEASLRRACGLVSDGEAASGAELQRTTAAPAARPQPPPRPRPPPPPLRSLANECAAAGAVSWVHRLPRLATPHPPARTKSRLRSLPRSSRRLRAHEQRRFHETFHHLHTLLAQANLAGHPRFTSCRDEQKRGDSKRTITFCVVVSHLSVAVAAAAAAAASQQWASQPSTAGWRISTRRSCRM
eukprot:scaffold43868_cov45-Phaeocystis_antarctica.AAC.2